MLGGWSSNSKYALLGGLRSTAQMISYEVFMGLSLMGIVMLAGSFDLNEIVEAQRDLWFIVPQFFGFCVWVLAGIAVIHRTPFDLPEAEAELAAGYHTEYSGMKFGMFLVAEYVGIVLISSLTVTLFFGGWQAPFHIDDWYRCSARFRSSGSRSRPACSWPRSFCCAHRCRGRVTTR